MIPLTDNLPPPPRPFVTYGLLGFILGLFAWQVHLSAIGQLETVLLGWGLIPSRLAAVTSQVMGGNNPAAWVAWVLVASSLVTGMFLHSSFAQILGNGIFLWVFGRRLESYWGSGKFLLFFVGMGILTGLLQVLIDPQLETPLVGTNGSIAAIIGAYLVAFPRTKIATILPLGFVFIPLELPALFFGFWWFVQQLAYGIGQLSAISVNQGLLAYWSHGLAMVWGAIIMGASLRSSPKVVN